MISEPKETRHIRQILVLTDWLVDSNGRCDCRIDVVCGFLTPLHLEIDGRVWAGGINQ